MDSRDKSNNFKKLSNLPVNNCRQQAELLHPLSRRHSLASTNKRSRFIRQKRIYSSVDNSDCNTPNFDSAEDQYYSTNCKRSGNQMNLTNSYSYNNYIFMVLFLQEI